LRNNDAHENHPSSPFQRKYGICASYPSGIIHQHSWSTDFCTAVARVRLYISLADLIKYGFVLFPFFLKTVFVLNLRSGDSSISRQRLYALKIRDRGQGYQVYRPHPVRPSAKIKRCNLFYREERYIS
jgi:hypothetical protein